MEQALTSSLHSFDKKKLKPTETKVTTTSGDKLIEKRDSEGRVTTEKVDGKTYGFVASVVEDLQVGEILPGLIIGSQDVALDLPTLERYNVTHILNLASYIEPKFPDKFVYKDIKILDVPETNIIQYFDEAFEFIDTGRKSGCVLVHCNAGVSRSATIVIAYLMKRLDMKFTEAFDLVKEKRPSICPNAGFQIQLGTYEQTLAAEQSSTNINK